MEMIEEIYTYKAEYSKTSAHKYVEGILEKIQRLKNYPEACAPCRNPKQHYENYNNRPCLPPQRRFGCLQ
jgi:plasmid stabilization system protein ParE